MKFTRERDYSIRTDSGIVIRVSGMRAYEVEIEGLTLSVPVDYSGTEPSEVNVWVGGVQEKDQDAIVAIPESVVLRAVNVLAEYLLSTSARVRIRWSSEREELRVPEHVPLAVRLGNKIAGMYWPKRRK